MTLLTFPLTRALSHDAPLSPVIDRPDRRMSLLRRAALYLRRAQVRGTLVRTLTGFATARLRAAADDLIEACRPTPRLTAVWPGADMVARAHAIAVYVHYAPTGDVSEMVLHQVAAYRRLGFCVVFVSMCPGLPPAILPRLQAITGLIVQRRNHGLDFGAWHDLAPLLQSSAPHLRELLLVNDSVCGPLRPLPPLFASLRAAGDGLFGLTENLAPRPHLQSYFLLARGRPACADLLGFLAAFRPTADKRRVIRRGEVRLSGWMRARGHHVAARYGYQAVEATSLRRRRTRQRLRHLFAVLFKLDSGSAMIAALRHHPVNPTHALWEDLISIFDFPFIKTDLLLRNPIGITDLDTWRQLASSQDLSLIEDHLRRLGLANHPS